MNYFKLIKNDDKTMAELMAYFESEFPKYHDLFFDGLLNRTDKGRRHRGTGPTGVAKTVGLYLTAYIHEKKPMTIIEYGSGLTTHLMATILNDLDYGGRLVAFEDQKAFYDLCASCGYYEQMTGANEVRIAPLQFGCHKHLRYSEYIHDLNEFSSIDFVFDDGPDIHKYGTWFTNNITLIERHFQAPFDFLIDGRITSQKYHKEIFGECVRFSGLGLNTSATYDRADAYSCGIGTAVKRITE